MHLIHESVALFDASLPEVAVKIDRRRLARRLWRAIADDGTEFGIEVEMPLKHGDVVWAGANARYVIRQAPEPVLEISLEVGPDDAAVIGWAVGNLHSAIEVRTNRLFAPDDPGLRQTLDRLGIRYDERDEVFQPHRLSFSLAGHDQLRDRTRELSHPHDHDYACQH
jgi:urease accessory protein